MMKLKKLVISAIALAVLVAMICVVQAKNEKEETVSQQAQITHTTNSRDSSTTRDEAKTVQAGVGAASPTYGAQPGGGIVASPTYGFVSGDYSWIELDRYFDMKGGKDAYRFGESLYDKDKTAEDYDKMLRELVKAEDRHHDVILGVVAKHYTDIVLGQSREAKEARKAIRKVEDLNDQVNELIAERVESNLRGYEVKVADELLAKLDEAVSVKVEKKSVKDIFCQNHFDLIPGLDVDVSSVMLMEPIQEEVWALVYTYEDGKTVEFSIDDHFAPINLTNYLKIKPGDWEEVLDK